MPILFNTQKANIARQILNEKAMAVSSLVQQIRHAQMNLERMSNELSALLAEAELYDEMLSTGVAEHDMAHGKPVSVGGIKEAITVGKTEASLVEAIKTAKEDTKKPDVPPKGNSK